MLHFHILSFKKNKRQKVIHNLLVFTYFIRKIKKAGEIAQKRKGKIRMNMYFLKKDIEIYVSHIKEQKSFRK